MTILALDIGNTSTHFGLFGSKGSLDATFTFPTAAIISGDRVNAELIQQLSSLGNLDSIFIASVVPEATKSLEQLLKRSHAETKVRTLKNQDVPLINRYQDPSKVGIDRLLVSLAAYTNWGRAEKKSTIVIDFGTATTFDCTNAGGEYLGGIIALGVASTANQLSRIAAQLPKIALEFPHHVLGSSTTESMQSGILFGALAMTEGLLTRIQEEVFPNQEIIVAATGGLAKLFEGRTSIINHFALNLVLEGIAITVNS